MHVHIVASLKKYIAWFTYILSKTSPFGGDISYVNFIHVVNITCLNENKKEVYDLNGKILIHIDGIGFIYGHFASKCLKNVFERKHLSN